MTSLDELLGDEFRSAEAQLAFELAQEDQHLIAELIRIREERGLSQQAVADLLGLSQATISAFERLGNDPHLSTIRRYCRALGVMVRHHISETACDPATSEVLSHVHHDGVDLHDTAAAVARKIKDRDLGSWPAVRESPSGVQSVPTPA